MSESIKGQKRKAASSVRSAVKSKRFKTDDASSVLSLTPSIAYGARAAFDESDIDDDMMSTVGHEKPINFIPLNTSLLSRDNGVLFSEDLTDDYDVWTLQCPDDVDINELLNQKINFDEVTTLKMSNSMSAKVDLIPYASQKDTNITVVTPSEETKNLSLNVVALAGTLIMSNRVSKEKVKNLDIPIDTVEDATKRRSELMSRITQRLSNKYDREDVYETDIKKEIKIEIESPKKIKKNKHKVIT